MKWLSLLLLPLVLLAALVWYLAREVPAPMVAIPDDATAVLDDPRFAPPAGWHWAALDSRAGTLRWGYSAPLDARGVVLFLPGYSAPLEVYLESFTALNAAGFAVVAMDWPGQGGSARGSAHAEYIHATSLDGHLQAAADVLDEARSLYPGLPVMLVGVSMGGQLGARLIADHDSVAAAALVTPAFALYDGRPTAIEYTMLRLLNGAGLGQRYAPGSTDWVFDLDAHNGVASKCSHPNARTRLFYAAMVRDPSIRVGGMTNAFALALIDSGKTASSAAVLSHIGIPVWMPLAGSDWFVDNAAARSACAALANCRLQMIDEARHCLFEESDAFYRPFLDDLIAFLEQQVPVEPVSAAP